jgi:hypothetical protein
MKETRRKPMLVTFVRTGERRYAVRAAVDGKPYMEMSPAPGFDPLMPHDLQHFIVERALGIDRAIFGQLAAGGTARTFHATTGPSGNRAASRERRKRDRKSSRLMSDRQEDCARSERATYVCWHDWLSHSEDPALRAKARTMDAAANSILDCMTDAERALYTPAKLSEIRSVFSRLSERWSMLEIDESFTEPW